MGQEGKRLRELARGERAHLFLPIEPDFALGERIELDTPVELLDSLLFVVGVMLEQLILRATARILALASVTITLCLEGGMNHSRTVRRALPTNDRRLWIKLIHLDLEAHPPQSPILGMTLTAESGNTSKVQLGLFSPQLPEATIDATASATRDNLDDAPEPKTNNVLLSGTTLWRRAGLRSLACRRRLVESCVLGTAAMGSGCAVTE